MSNRGLSSLPTVLVVVTVVLFVVVFAIAAVVVGREARRLSAQEPRPVFDLDDAVSWVAQHLPFEVSAVLSYDDVRRILDWHLEYLRMQGVSSNGQGAEAAAGPVVIGGAESVDFVLKRSRGEGTAYTPAQVHAVLEAEMTYLEAIGAAGQVPDPDADLRPRREPPET